MTKAKKIVRKEAEVAFSKNTQPVGFRIIKYVLLSILVYFTCTKPFFWWMISALFGLSLVIHFYYRYKTKGWTRSFGMWNYEKFRKE